MVDALYQDGPVRGVQEREQPEVPDSKFPVLSGGEPAEESIRVGGGLLQLANDPSRDRRV